MIRRRTHVRSRKGCMTCKERHVRCDERLPYCRNCLRLGRPCRYTEEVAETQTSLMTLSSSSSTPDSDQVVSQQAWIARVLPQSFTLYYCPPQHRDIPSGTIWIIQQAGEITRHRPMPRSCLLTIVQNYIPRYNFLAAEHRCVRNALISFAAFQHWQATESRESKAVCISHTCQALKDLQQETATFGSHNADAVVTASIFLAGTAQSWEQFGVFVDGYSRALTQMAENNFPTIYPDFNRITDHLQMRRFSMLATPNNTPLPRDKIVMAEKVKIVQKSVPNVIQLLGIQRWRATGFEDLERLVNSISNALNQDCDIETFHKTSWLRTWLFWMDLRRTAGGDEQLLLTSLFYLLVLAIVPLFPTRYCVSMVDICCSKIKNAQESFTREEIKEFGVLDILERIRWE